MKRIMILALLVACSPKQASGWVYVGTYGNEILFVDSSSLRTGGNIRHAWWKYIPPPHTQKGTGSDTKDRWVVYFVYRSGFDCGQGKDKVEVQKEYFEDGSNWSSTPEMVQLEVWSPVARNLLLENASRFVCALPAGKPK